MGFSPIPAFSSSRFSVIPHAMSRTRTRRQTTDSKHDKVTVYAQDNIPLTISKAPCIRRDGARLEFDMDCADLADYCNLAGLSIKPNNH